MASLLKWISKAFHLKNLYALCLHDFMTFKWLVGLIKSVRKDGQAIGSSPVGPNKWLMKVKSNSWWKNTIFHVLYRKGLWVFMSF